MIKIAPFKYTPEVIQFFAYFVILFMLPISLSESSYAHSYPVCWDGSVTDDLKKCPPEPKRLCPNGKMVSISKPCSLEAVQFQISGSLFKEPLNLSVFIEDGKAARFSPVSYDEFQSFMIHGDRRSLAWKNNYKVRPKNYNVNYQTSCPGDSKTGKCPMIFWSVTKKLDEEIISFNQTSYYELEQYPQMRCVAEQIFEHAETYFYGKLPNLTIYC